MLIVDEDLVLVIMVHDVAEDDVFYQLAADGCYRDWPIIGCCTLVSFLVNRGNVSNSPIFGDTTRVQ